MLAIRNLIKAIYLLGLAQQQLNSAGYYKLAEGISEFIGECENNGFIQDITTESITRK